MSAVALPVTEQIQLHGPAYEWPLWASTIRVVTADSHALPSARRLIEAELAHIELVASPFYGDSEASSLPSGRRTRISKALTALLGAALDFARETDGGFDPTLGHPIQAVHEGAPADDRAWLAPGGSGGVELDEAAQTVLVPRGVQLDLERMTSAWAVDRCAATVAEVLDVAVLVSLGGHIATAGPPASGAWEILVGGAGDHRADSAALVAVPTGLAVATAIRQSGEPFDGAFPPSARPVWRRQNQGNGHASSPGIPDPSPWRSATVVAADCVTAMAWSTAALAQEARAVEALEQRGLPARLVALDGKVRHVAGWPEDAEMTAT
jgi:thiamine biosynthesis lipoprotein